MNDGYQLQAVVSPPAIPVPTQASVNDLDVSLSVVKNS
ncbi:hypothetical protein WM41_0532 [Corynebacterium simulans]|uniref:Uncharacterized protein n=1 Tax=Corynebacterium simulans TaxID=146827 RepID=A0ABR5VBI1_9CORY|nr:hypothetical protein WM41_0532 [Corynebacterium simulans]